MSEITYIHSPDTSRLTRICELVAAMIPACVIGYSALVDPMLNIGTLGNDVGGVMLGAESKSTTLTKIVMSAFLLASLAIAIWVKPVIPHRLRLALIPGGMLLALACVSAAWGKAPIDTLMLAVYQSMLFATLLISVAVSADPRRIVHFLILMLALVVAANLMAILMLPPAPNGHPGIYLYKNTLGGAAGCALLFGLFHLFQGRLAWRAIVWFTTLGAVFATLASDSKAALALAIGAPLLAALFFLMSWGLAIGPIATSLLMVALIVAGFHVVAGMMALDFDDVLIAIYGGTSFTGRTDIWAIMYEHMSLSPWFGNGYRGFWMLDASPKLASENTWVRTIGGGHNGYLDIRLDLGIVGLCLLILFMAISFQTIGKLGSRPLFRSLSYLAVFVFLAFRNTMESTILWSTHFDNLIFLLVCFLACYDEAPHEKRTLPVTSWQAQEPSVGRL